MTSVSPEQILHDLSALWVDLGRQSGEEGAGVLRACTMTLIVLAREADDPQALGETLARLMPEHPSRAVVLRVTPSPDRAMSARVFSQCWTAFEKHQHICAEQIEMVSTEGALPEARSVLLALLVPDLPVVLWCRGMGLFDLAGFDSIASLATKVVTRDAAFERLQSLIAPSRSVGDLAWTHITPWRQLIARILENRFPASLAQFTEVRVGFGGAPISARYLAAWLVDSLHRAGASPRVRILDVPAEEKRVELAAPDVRLSVAKCGAGCAEVRVNDALSQAALPELSDYSLMREELAIPCHDPVFERTLTAAARLALSS